MKTRLPGVVFCLGLSIMPAAPSLAQSPENGVYRDAFLAFFPLYEMARLRYQAVEAPNSARPLKPNEFSHARRLLDHTDRRVTAPNNDTLYSSAWLDLSAGPILLDVPAMGERYYSFHFMNAYTDNIAIIGLRNAGGGAYRVAIVGPDWNGVVPPHAHRVNMDTNDVWLLGRLLASDKNDAKAVAQLQDQIRLTVPPVSSGHVAQTHVPALVPNPEQFVSVVNEMLRRNPPQGAAAVRAKAAQAVGIGAQPAQGAWAALPESIRSGWTSQWASLRGELTNPAAVPRPRVGSWFYPPPNVGQWGDRLLLRATVALRGIGALDVEEAMYFNGLTDQHGAPLDGSKRYRMRVPAGGIPVNGFWSVTMYEATPDGRYFFTPNPIDRYSIGNRTAGLQPNADGTMDIFLQAERPSDAAQAANWLPTPRGPFRMSLRAYLPKAQLVEGRAALPVVEALTQ